MKYSLDQRERDRVLSWARKEITIELARSSHGSKYEELRQHLFAVHSILTDMALHGDEELSELVSVRDEELRSANNFLKDQLLAKGAAFKTPREWSIALIPLFAAVDSLSMPRQRPGTTVEVDRMGRPIGDEIAIGGGVIDPRGRRQARPLLNKLVRRLLDDTQGRLTFDKNTGLGSLADALNSLRPDLQEIIPLALPTSTIAGVVAKWRTASRSDRTKKRGLRLVK